MTRRVLLRMAWLVGLVGGWTGTWMPRPAGAVDANANALSPSEIEDLLAFAEIVVEGPLAPSGRADLLAHIDDRLERRPGSLELYRTTVRLLARLAGQRFSALDPAARLELVGRHRLGVPDVRPSESLGPFADDVRAVRSRVVRDVIGGYYASPSGWAAVGYAAFPGRCGDLTRYTRAET